jgi:hypothetical protein
MENEERNLILSRLSDEEVSAIRRLMYATLSMFEETEKLSLETSKQIFTEFTNRLLTLQDAKPQVVDEPPVGRNIQFEDDDE